MRNQEVNRSSQPSFEPLERRLESRLAALEAKSLRRQLRRVEGRQGPRMRVDGQPALMLGGSNYLDLAGDERVVSAARAAAREYGCAAGGSRLINGNLEIHEALERELAAFAGTESALLFSTGYMANLGLITALAGPEDVVVSDALNHASIIDACRLSRAETRVFRHNDPEDFEKLAGTLSGFRERILVADGVYSMDGDIARLRELVPIARRHEMRVVLDDAHGLGILGETGRGSAEHEQVEVDVQIGNLGKALGSFGAYVACSATLREFLINVSRSFIFTCAPAPAAAGAARAALSVIREEPWRRRALLERAAQLRDGLRAGGFDTGLSESQIVPAILGDNQATMRLCNAALARGVYAHGIRYPSVPDGGARLRFTPMCSHTLEEIDEVVRVFHELAHADTHE